MRHAIEIADDVRSGRVTAISVVERCLVNLASENFSAITHILADRARQEAALVDTTIAGGRDPGSLAGVPYGVKDLFDVAGLATTAGSSIYADAPPAEKDAEAVDRLRRAGAVLVATLNMDEFAYGFATINATYGTTRNPHDIDRLAGGSSGGSAAIVSAGLLPLSLGSDTNGSIRVPASLTGIYGIKPAHGTLPMGGVFPFADSFDDAGPFALSVADLRRVWEVLTGKALKDNGGDFRVARLVGRFAENVDPDQLSAMTAIAPDAPIIELPDIARARSAAFLITAYEGGMFHREVLAREAMQFDPATRDRFLAGALIPKSLYDEAQAFRQRFKTTIAALIADYNVLLAPSAPCVAPTINHAHILIDGDLKPARSDLGIHTQPISFTGLPSMAVPLLRPGKLPLGLQLIGKAGEDSTLFDFAAMLEKKGVTGASPPPGGWATGDFQGEAS